MKSKKCTKCKEIKPFSGFSKNKATTDGFQCWCKGCKLAWQQSPIGKASKKKNSAKYYQANKEQIKKSEAEYRKTPNGRVNQLRGSTKHRLKYPDRYKARNKINNAIQDGNIPPVKTLKCSKCPSQAEQYHHYLGYTEEHWLDVIALCRPCHDHLTNRQKEKL